MSSYSKNTSNNSGIVIDNLQVNQSATIPNQLTQNGDYVGENGIGGSKSFKNNVNFQNGISAQGSSTINNLTITGSFSLPSGSFVDTTSSQTITGQKTFTSTLITNQVSIQPGYNLSMGSTSRIVNNGISSLYGDVAIGNPALSTSLQINSPTTIGSVNFPNNLLVNGTNTCNGLTVPSGTTQLGSNYQSIDAQNTGLFVGDAKATTKASVSGIIIPTSLVQVTQLPIYSGGYKQISNGLQITVINTSSNVFGFNQSAGDLASMLFQNNQCYHIGVNSGQPQSVVANKYLR